MDLLLALGLILILGLAGALVSRRLSLPTITGYVVMGLILGPTVSGVIKADAVVALDTITAISLGVIAYLIGTSLRIDTVRSLGKSIASITILEAVTAFLAVVAVLAFVTGYFIPGLTLRESYVPFALVMGAAACATAPAAVLAIVREYRAKGPLTTTLLAVVALDDAVAVILFAVAMAVGGALVGNSHALSALDVALTPVLHISGAIGVGAGFAFMVGLFSRFVRTRELTLVLVLGAVILSYGVCNVIGVSGIMANMTFGFVIGNRRGFEQMVVALEDFEPVLYAMFFVLAGLHFDAAVFATAGPLALIVVVVRCVGKYIGTRVGAWVGGAERQVGAYLGMALLPQAGVSIGLTLIGAASFPELAAPMVSVTLASVIINELITPPLLRSALVKAGEARIDPSKGDSGGQATVEAAAAEGESPRVKGSAHEHDISTGKPSNGTRALHLPEGP